MGLKIKIDLDLEAERTIYLRGKRDYKIVAIC